MKNQINKTLTQISVVIPAFNEEKNILPLVKRIDQALKNASIDYEIIFIDDFSTDKTCQVISSLIPLYPISLYMKKGAKHSKAQSLIEGFSYAKYSLIAMIDADLQYTPETIPSMINTLLETGSDIVVANRKSQQSPILRQFLHWGFQTFFVKFLHNINVDAQSGLKVFRQEILTKVTLNPTPWTFDLEFLVKAQKAGYTVTSVDTIFQSRLNGESKVNPLKASWEIGSSAVKLKMAQLDVISFSKEKTAEGAGFYFKGKKYITHTKLPAEKTALYTLTTTQRWILYTLVALFINSLFWNWHSTILIFIALINILYFTDLLFNFYLIYRSFSKKPEIDITPAEIKKVSDSEWPTYTVFCPLYKEWEVFPQFVTAINELDYPKNKLQVMLLLEKDDVQTIRNAQLFNLPDFFEIVIVPPSFPRTKPKACNYGLLKAKGEYCVIYDAEDIPEPDQLKKAVLAFKKAGLNKTACIQAKLNFYNPHQNILTRLFTAEYSLWFDLVLTGLQSISAPIPLGGTSNHFPTAYLRKLQGWDAFNVTEDCDLGMRIVKDGRLTAIVNSTTFEEANSQYLNWYKQRTRWIKGYMQSYLIHMRDPRAFKNTLKNPHLLTFQFVVGAKILSMFINPFLWLLTISYFVFRPIIGPTIDSFYPNPVLYLAVISVLFGNFLYLYYYMVGCVKREQYSLIKYIFLVPFYWLGMSIAAWGALYDLIKNPHYWAKTKHGLHLDNKAALSQAKSVIGSDLVDKNIAGAI